jgi:hypothetical protein
MNREVWLLAVSWSKDIRVNDRGWRWKEAGFGISIDFTARDACINLWVEWEFMIDIINDQGRTKELPR